MQDQDQAEATNRLKTLLEAVGFINVNAQIVELGAIKVVKGAPEKEGIEIDFLDSNNQEITVSSFIENFSKKFPDKRYGYTLEKNNKYFLKITREKSFYHTDDKPLIEVVMACIEQQMQQMKDDINSLTFSATPPKTPKASAGKQGFHLLDTTIFASIMELAGPAKEFFEILMKQPAFHYSLFSTAAAVMLFRWGFATYEFFKGNLNKNLSSTVGFIDLTVKTFVIVAFIIGSLLGVSFFAVATPVVFAIATALDLVTNVALMFKDVVQLVRLAWHQKALTDTDFGKEAHAKMVQHYADSLKGHVIGSFIALVLTTAITALMLAPHVSVPFIVAFAAVKVAGVALGTIAGSIAGAILGLSVVKAVGEFIAKREFVKNVKDFVYKTLNLGEYKKLPEETPQKAPKSTNVSNIKNTVDKFKQLGFDGISLNLDQMAVEYLHENFQAPVPAQDPVQAQDQAPAPAQPQAQDQDQDQDPAPAQAPAPAQPQPQAQAQAPVDPKAYLTCRLDDKLKKLETEINSDDFIFSKLQKGKRESKKALLEKAKKIMEKGTILGKYQTFSDINENMKDAKNKQGTWSSFFRDKSETQELVEAVDLYHKNQNSKSNVAGG